MLSVEGAASLAGEVRRWREMVAVGNPMRTEGNLGPRLCGSAGLLLT